MNPTVLGTTKYYTVEKLFITRFGRHKVQYTGRHVTVLASWRRGVSVIGCRNRQCDHQCDRVATSNRKAVFIRNALSPASHNDEPG